MHPLSPVFLTRAVFLPSAALRVHGVGVFDLRSRAGESAILSNLRIIRKKSLTHGAFTVTFDAKPVTAQRLWVGSNFRLVARLRRTICCGIVSLISVFNGLILQYLKYYW